MSSISGVGQSLSQYFQSISANSPAQPTSVTSSASAADSAAAGSATTTPVHGKGHHHHGHGGGSKQIQQAVTDALQSASTSGSSTDPNQTIQDAIAKVFQNSNSATPTSASTTTGSDPDGDDDTDAAGEAGGDNTAQQAFLKALQSFGVDPQQFHQDFLAAVKDAQGGQINPNTAFQSFPPGTFVDTTG